MTYYLIYSSLLSEYRFENVSSVLVLSKIIKTRRDIADKLMPGVPKALEIRTDFTVLTVTFHLKKS